MSVDDDQSPGLADTNVLVYAYDRTDLTKHAIAVELPGRLSREGRLVFSAQVFNEFCSVLMRPAKGIKLAPDQVTLTLRRLEATGRVLPITSSLTFRALDAMPRHGLSFWDALIWAAAAENGIPLLYTEDFQDGRLIEGVRYINPFAAGPPPTP